MQPAEAAGTNELQLLLCSLSQPNFNFCLILDSPTAILPVCYTHYLLMEKSIEALSIVLSTTYDKLDYNNYNNQFTEYKQGIKNSEKLIFQKPKAYPLKHHNSPLLLIIL